MLSADVAALYARVRATRWPVFLELEDRVLAE